MSKVIMGNGGYYGCLSEPQGISAWWKKAQKHAFGFSRSLLLNRLEPQSSKAKLSLPIMPNGVVAYAFTLSWDNLCRNSCISNSQSGQLLVGLIAQLVEHCTGIAEVMDWNPVQQTTAASIKFLTPRN